MRYAQRASGPATPPMDEVGVVCGKLLSTVTMNTSSAAALSSTWHSWKRLVVTCDSSLSSRPPLTA